jgi:serine/threonine protein kinase
MPLAQGQVIAGYTIVRSIGAGGMGEVYLGQHPRLPRRNALKVLAASVCADDEYRVRFNREADIAATLWHPHIVEVHDRGDVGGQLWISMDYVEGTDAGRMLTERYASGMPPELVMRIVTAVAEALDYAHDKGLTHRDVKPANVLIADPGDDYERIMLADFGIARRADDTSNLTGTNMTVGTVAYAAPEQLTGEVIDGRADQYALASTAYQLLTGFPPFRHSNPAVVISQHLTAKRRTAVIGGAVALAVLAVAAVAFIVFDRHRDHPPAVAKSAAGGPAYCAHLPTTDAAVWSLYPGEISSPTVTPGPDEEVYAPETESPVLVCMEQTGQGRLDCHDDILQSNAGSQPTDAPAATSALGAP